MHFIESAKEDVNVVQVGVVRSLADVAKHNGGLYGIFSIVAALGAGFEGVSMVFEKRGGAR